MNLRDFLLQVLGEEEEVIKKSEKKLVKRDKDLEPGMHIVEDEDLSTSTESE